jgi:hypothetical protein
MDFDLFHSATTITTTTTNGMNGKRVSTAGDEDNTQWEMVIF